MPTPTLTPAQRAQVNKWMTAFRYGGKVDDLGKVDDRHNSGQYDDVTWHVALDGATLYGFDGYYKPRLIEALAHGLEGIAVEEHAWNMACLDVGYDTDVDKDWVKPEWAEVAK